MKIVKTLAIGALCLSFSNISFAKEAKNKYDFSLEASVDHLSGIAYENVYSDNKKISELVWQIKDLHMGTLRLEVPIYERLVLRTSYSTAIDRGSNKGTMVNSDWLGGSGYDNGNANANNWTDRANSNVEIAQANNFDANLSYNVFYNINFNLGYKRTYFKWRDFGRDYIYSESSFRDTSGNFGGATGIIYDQTMNIPYIGLEVQQPLFKNKLLLTLSGAYSDQVSATGYDQHLVRNLDFRDEFEGGEYYNIGAKFDYFATKNLAIGFAYEYNEVKEIIGNSVTTNTTSGASTSCSDCAGLSNKYEKFSLSMKYLFDIPESVTSLFIQ